MSDCPINNLPKGHMPAYGRCPVCHEMIFSKNCADKSKEIDFTEFSGTGEGFDSYWETYDKLINECTPGGGVGNIQMSSTNGHMRVDDQDVGESK